MLDELFGSRTRVKLLQLFLTRPQEQFYVRELTRKLDEHINSVRRELNHLETLGLIGSQQRQRKKYYLVNTQFNLYTELKSLFVKARVVLEKEFVAHLQRVGSIQYLSLLGFFVDDETSAIDLFIVGSLPKKHLVALLEDCNAKFGRELRYTIMPTEEYHYRRSVTDKFLYAILHNQQVVVIDRFSGK
ncbi:MAG: transcriptional regulator [Candidatus Kerfeldbacteria bacterium]|nr:transcriptional regulator [Candidatus Kerfeldbacteria bacterium]